MKGRSAGRSTLSTNSAFSKAYVNFFPGFSLQGKNKTLHAFLRSFSTHLARLLFFLEVQVQAKEGQNNQQCVWMHPLSIAAEARAVPSPRSVLQNQSPSSHGVIYTEETLWKKERWPLKRPPLRRRAVLFKAQTPHSFVGCMGIERPHSLQCNRCHFEQQFLRALVSAQGGEWGSPAEQSSSTRYVALYHSTTKGSLLWRAAPGITATGGRESTSHCCLEQPLLHRTQN